MATDIYNGNKGHTRLAGASKGVSLSTTAAFVGLHRGTQYVDLIPRNFSTAVVMRYAACPYIVVLKTADALASQPVDYTEVAQDGSTSTSVDLSSLPTLANGGNVWVGCPLPYRGAHIDVDGANSTANTLTVHYPNAGLALTNISATDNTASGGVSLAQDGTVTWTVPAAGAWRSATLRQICVANSISITAARFAYDDVQMYWTRWSWNAAMDAATTLDHILALNESTAYAEIPESLAVGERVHMDVGGNGIAGYEMLTDAGTGNCLVNCAALGGYFSLGTVR